MSMTRSITTFRSPTRSRKTLSGARGGTTIMEGFIATKLDDFAQGKISRRKLIETLTSAVTALCAAKDANAASADPALKVALVNHVSYTCSNFKEAADWYSKVFNLDQVGSTANDVAL